MNVEEQTSPGPGANGALASATIYDLLAEIKQRCVACALVSVVTDDNGEDITMTTTLGSRLVLLGACERIKHNLLHDED